MPSAYHFGTSVLSTCSANYFCRCIIAGKDVCTKNFFRKIVQKSKKFVDEKSPYKKVSECVRKRETEDGKDFRTPTRQRNDDLILLLLLLYTALEAI